MIVGIGIDLCPISRMRDAIARHGGRFEARVFTDGERADCNVSQEPAQHYAARFAAKEAAVKACSVLRGQSWHDVEVIREADGRPRLRLHGPAAEAVAALGVARMHVSLTHAADAAVAVVIAESED
ncbi:MAG: holo-ACP synthase [Polyangia bacterium]